MICMNMSRFTIGSVRFDGLGSWLCPRFRFGSVYPRFKLMIHQTVDSISRKAPSRQPMELRPVMVETTLMDSCLSHMHLWRVCLGSAPAHVRCRGDATGGDGCAVGEVLLLPLLDRQLLRQEVVACNVSILEGGKFRVRDQPRGHHRRPRGMPLRLILTHEVRKPYKHKHG